MTKITPELRAGYEKRFPPHRAIVWNPERETYAAVSGTGMTGRELAAAANAEINGWVEGRAELVVTLPPVDSADFAGVFWHEDDVRKALAVAGVTLKVEADEDPNSRSNTQLWANEIIGNLVAKRLGGDHE